jgi:hypothetical protein
MIIATVPTPPTLTIGYIDQIILIRHDRKNAARGFKALVYPGQAAVDDGEVP